MRKKMTFLICATLLMLLCMGNSFAIDKTFPETVLRTTDCPTPTNLKATPDYTSVLLTWDDVGAASYVVFINSQRYSVSENKFSISLIEGTGPHTWKVAALCDITHSSDTIPGTPFSTLACTTPIKNFPWEYDFENSALTSCWSQECVLETTKWIRASANNGGTVTSAHSGTSFGLFYTNASMLITKLVTPRLDISKLTNPTLKFWYTKEKKDPFSDILNVYYKNSSSGNWTELASYTASSSDWKEGTIKLPKSSSTYYIAFEGKAFGGYGITLDDITVFDFVCDKITKFPVTENFETDSWICWKMMSMNDVNDWTGTILDAELSWGRMGLFYTLPKDNLSFAFSSREYASDYNQYLISPELPANTGLTLTFDYATHSTHLSEEIFRVGYSTTTNSIAAFKWFNDTIANNDFIKVGFKNFKDNFPAGTKYIAIHYKTPYKDNLFIDNIVIDGEIIEITSFTPEKNAQKVELDAEVALTFSIDITGKDNLPGITINGKPVTATILGNKLTIAHDIFDYNTTYTVIIPVNTIEGYGNEIRWSFTTKDTSVTPLNVVTLIPDKDEVNVTIDAEVSVTFNKDIIENDLSDITINGIAVAGSTSGNRLTIIHNAFEYDTTYTVFIPANTIEGYDKDITWSFTTEKGGGISVIDKDGIKIYPNPSSGLTNITVSENSAVQIVDITGRLIETHHINANSTVMITQPAGIYFVRVESNGKISTHKLVIGK